MFYFINILVAILFNSSFAADDSIQIFFKTSPPRAGIVVINEVEPGDLKTFVDTLDQNKAGHIEAGNLSKSVAFNCKTDPVNTSCTFTFVESDPIVFVNPPEQNFWASDIQENFYGLDVLKQNPTLSLALNISQNGNSFSLNLSDGRLSATGTRQ